MCVCEQVPRSQRFPGTFLSHLETLIMTMSDHIFWKSKDLPEETRSASQAIAAFVKVRACAFLVCLKSNLIKNIYYKKSSTVQRLAFKIESAA